MSLGLFGACCVALALGLPAANAFQSNRSATGGRVRNELGLIHKQHRELHAAFAKKLDEVARFCDDKQLDLEAAEIRKLAVPLDTRLLRVDPLPRNVQLELPADLPPDERYWRTQLRHARREYAKDLYLLSRRALNKEYVSYAYDMVREVAMQDPDHAAARKLLGFVRYGSEWVTPFAATMLKKRHVWSDQFGWLPKDDLPRYENGERRFDGRWISAAQEAEIRRDFSKAWEIRTEHYLIKTNHSLERGVELGQQLEDFYRIFFQTFAGFFNSRHDIQQLFDGTGSQKAAAPFVVHYYRTQDEYNRRLRGKIGQAIESTIGLYMSNDRIAYFFHDPNGAPESQTTLFHEATHQLFSETRFSRQSVGSHANFWIIEGIACYMESFEQNGDLFSLGNPHYIRFQAARTRYVRDRYYVPFRRFASLGMHEFQGDSENLPKNYSQASGLTHFFLHYDGGVYREDLIEHLSDIYSLRERIRENPRSLEAIIGVDAQELDRQYGEYIANLGAGEAASAE
jgi:hypothetical protein